MIQVTTGLSRSGGGPFFSVSGLTRAVNNGGAVRASVVGAYRDAGDWPSDRAQWEPVGLDAFPGAGIGPVWQLAAATCNRVAAARARGLPAAVHLHGIWDGGSLAVSRVAKRINDAPIVVSPRGMLEPWALRQSRLKKKAAWVLWQKRQLVEAAMIHATADQEYENVRQLGLRSPVAVVPNGVELPEIDCAIDPARDAPRRCVFLSRVHPKKGLPMLLEAWRRVAPRDWSLEIAGAGEAGHDEEIRQRICQFGLTNVKMVGDLRGDAKWRFLQSAQLFVLPSYSENFGVAVAEAMGAGLPVITTRTTPWKAVCDRGLGWWVDPRVDDLAAALAQATRESPESLRDRGRRARAHVLSEYGWARIGQRMAACYLWLLGLGPATEDLRFT